MAEPAWKSLVKRLQAESPCFAELWRHHDVNPELSPTKRYLHPEVGLLTFNFTYLYLGRRSESRLSVYTPANPETAEKIQAAVPRKA
jgi:hypothetical protein